MKFLLCIAVALCVTGGHALRIPARKVAVSPHRTLGGSIEVNLRPSPEVVLGAASGAIDVPPQSAWREKLQTLRYNKRARAVRWLNRVTNVFPLWVLGASGLGYVKPELFSWFTPFITPALACTMLAMGMTLELSDFKRVAKNPQLILIGFLAQFSIMPAMAYAWGRLLQLGPDLATGLILVGCAPGGTASNLVSLIAQADVALSVLMTLASTTAAIILTPYLSAALAGSYVQINALTLILSTVQVVFAPVIAGLAISTAAPETSKKVSNVTPAFSVLLISLICGSISAGNARVNIAVSPMRLLGSVTALHASGFGLGYLLSKKFGISENKARTISIETGMQNSALAVVLARHLPNPMLSSLPGAVSATVHSCLGSLLAAYWRKHPARGAGAWDKGLRVEDELVTETFGIKTVVPPEKLKIIPDQVRGSDEGLV